MIATRLTPRYQTIGVRKGIRRDIRNVLGTGRDDAPQGRATVRAAFLISKLMFEATNGKLDVLVTWRDRCISEVEALKAVDDARYAPQPAGAVVLCGHELESLHTMLDNVPQGVLNRFPATLDKIGYGENNG